ncbi:MAG TPA: MurR/RpiR family transcriptional regulator [Thermomicrobiales bacterium]|nr:MurR/RpiR family transcriptional regulator [Thermomicrobiales bacterium]
MAASRTVILREAGKRADGAGVRLSRKQRSLVSYIEHNPKFAAFATAAELGQRVGVHPSTVVRLAQLLGYDGFPAFQEMIRHRYLNSLDAIGVMNAHADERHGDVVLASVDQDARNLSATRSTLDADAVRRVARLIEQAPATLILGAGSHGGLAVIFSHLCRYMGLPVDAEIRGGVPLAARLASVNPGDVVIGTAAWWVIQDTGTALAVARERGATTVAIVETRASDLAQVADHVLIARTESVSFFQSMVGPLAVLNAIIAELATNGGDAIRERMQVATTLFDRFGVAWSDGATTFEFADRTGANESANQP